MKSMCDRCKNETYTTIMSMFNKEMCCDDCIKTERAHPEFEKARKTELDQIQAGNYNYPGIGLPSDLIGGGHDN